MADAVRRQYNKLKIQTKAEIRQTIDQLLVGEFIVRKTLHNKALLFLRVSNTFSKKKSSFSLLLQENSKRWTMKLDICAPQVIFPDDFQSEDPMLVIVDLGRILLTNSQGEERKIITSMNFFVTHSCLFNIYA